MKLEVGMYVRDKGIIKKIESIHKNCEGYKTEISLTKTYPRLQDYEIKKASFNLIDLIEVGDYVNGERVGASRYGLYVGFDEMEEPFMLEDIKIYEVLTHELYEANCYKVGE